MRTIFGAALPDYTEPQWQQLARQSNRGHAPQLDEPASLAAIDRFLDGLAD